MKKDNEIFKRYLQDNTNEEEKDLIENWFSDFKPNQVKQHQVTAIVEKIDKKIFARVANPSIKHFWEWHKIVAAAVLLVSFSFFCYKFYDDHRNLDVIDILSPTKSNAIIVFSNQREVALDDIHVGDSIRADGYYISRNLKGELIYIVDKENPNPIYHTIKTKAGGFTSFKLSDGSQIWINSNSEVRYPVKFESNFREVFLTGEGYFEISKDNRRPFYVRTQNQNIKVLGTKFNVNAKGKRVVSTLISGKIALKNNTLEESGQFYDQQYPIVLNPSQAYNGTEVTDVDNPYLAIDWKDGYFNFTGLSVDEACRKMSDWYGVDFQVQEEVKYQRLFGEISRDEDLNQVLKLIKEVVPIKYQLKDGVIFITKNQ